MPAPTIADTLKFANLQMAAEALYRFNATQVGVVLTPGAQLENPQALDTETFKRVLTDGNLHASKFTTGEAEKFVTQWRVVEHISNTPTGFSGTLFEDKVSGDLVLSFRSTEFLDDHARDNTATNFLEISKFGFAFGQIADMEKWYGDLKAAGKIPAGAQVSVTGYSLGGHLATAFNLLHQNDLNGGQVVLFNGAGVGKIGTADGTLAGTQAKLRQMIDGFRALRAQGGGSGLLDRFQSAEGRQAYLDIQAHLASTLGVPRAAVGGGFNDALVTLANAVRPNSPEGANAALRQYDYDLLYGAVTRIKAVYEAAHRAPTLSSGASPGPDAGPPNPANIQDLYTRPDGSQALAIAGESLDYQLAVLLTQKEFRAESLGPVYSLAAALGTPTRGVGWPLSNQWDVLGTETTTGPRYGVAYSQYRYGNDVKLFIEDQPLTRGDFVGATVAELLQGNIQLLHPNYALNDFGDTHSLVLIVDSLNVQTTLLNLIDPGRRPTATDTLATILKNASWRTAQPDSAQGQAEGDVLENVVNDLADLFLGPQPKDQCLNGNPNGNTWADIGDKTVGDIKYSGRESLYATLDKITKAAADKGLAGKLSLGDSTGITAEQGRKDFASFAALYSLSPFKLYTDDGLLQDKVSAAWGTAYSDWNYDKANAANPGAAMTYSDSWLADRADFLTRKNWFNERNLNPVDPGYQHNSSGDAYRNEDVSYWDVASDYRIAQGPVSGATRRYYFGDEQGNVLDGRAANGNSVADRLYGMAGHDILIGGQGNDHLDGGTGFDTYVWNSGSGFFGTSDGDDRIIDADRRGRLLINGSAAKLLVQKTATTWVSHDGKLTLTQPADSSGGWKLDIAGGGSLDLGSSLNDGDYGLYRQDAAPVLPTDPTIVGDRSPKEFTANFTGTIDYNKFGLGWYNSRITVTAEHADPEDATKSIVDAYKVTYNTKDALGNYVTEGDGSAPNRNDTLNGDATQADYIQAFGGNDEIDAKGGNDRIQAGTGDDLVSGGAGHDLVEGGSGADRLLGGDGRDTLWGDTTATGSTPIASAIASGETDASQNSKGDWIDGGTGDDILIGGTANDVLVAGAENDLLIGGAGDDLLLGDGIGQINPAASWSTGRQVSTDPDTKITSYTATFSGSSATWFSQFGGADMLYGGAGDDWVFAGAGDDQVDGGKGQDVLFGEAGNDVVLGGLDDDLIIGDSAGLAESLQGHDWLDGGEGDDTLEGMGGDDVLIGGKGDDSLVGGAGRDTYIYNKGDGVDTVIDDDTGAEKSILVFGEGVSKDSIKLRKGSLLLDLGNGDGVHIENFNADDPLGTQSIGSFNFADGTSLRATRLLSRRSEAAHRSRRWKDGASIGTESNDIYWRSVA